MEEEDREGTGEELHQEEEEQERRNGEGEEALGWAFHT